jgi:hypothetical protein
MLARASNGIATVMSGCCCFSASSIELRVDRYNTLSRSIRARKGVNCGTGKLNRKVSTGLETTISKNTRGSSGSKSIIQRYVIGRPLVPHDPQEVSEWWRRGGPLTTYWLGPPPKEKMGDGVCATPTTGGRDGSMS